MMFYFAENQNFSSAASIRCKEVVSSCNPERKMDKQSQPGGTIPLCPHKGCAFKCCDFQQMVHILLYPGELAEAIRFSLSWPQRRARTGLRPQRWSRWPRAQAARFKTAKYHAMKVTFGSCG